MIMATHTNVVVILSDGTHRTCFWQHEVDFSKIYKFFGDTIALAATHMDGKPTGVKPVWAFVAFGRDHTEYTGNEVEELARR
jgi:hypothetical protein